MRLANHTFKKTYEMKQHCSRSDSRNTRKRESMKWREPIIYLVKTAQHRILSTYARQELGSVFVSSVHHKEPQGVDCMHWQQMIEELFLPHMPQVPLKPQSLLSIVQIQHTVIN